MDLNHKFRTGKYSGRTVGEVYKLDRRYFNWILENRPEMLKSHGKAKSSNSYKQPVYKPTLLKTEHYAHPGRIIQPLEPGDINDAF
jgi:hypothetical protein